MSEPLDGFFVSEIKFAPLSQMEAETLYSAEEWVGWLPTLASFGRAAVAAAAVVFFSTGSALVSHGVVTPSLVRSDEAFTAAKGSRVPSESEGLVSLDAADLHEHAPDLERAGRLIRSLPTLESYDDYL